MTHKFSNGQNVYYVPMFGNAASRGKYKIVRSLPVENDNRLAYRIKSIAESFERIAEEHQLTRTDEVRAALRRPSAARFPPLPGQNSGFHAVSTIRDAGFGTLQPWLR